MKQILVLTATLLSMLTGLQAMETIRFPSSDGLEVTADLYMPHSPSAPFVLLFHMAGSSRGEYRDIAARLNELGFNAVAVDQRSGGFSNGVTNETTARAKAANLDTRRYLSALPDMMAALATARDKYARGKLVLWGSSYSASLVLKMAGDNPACCDAVLAFSPGEYFGPTHFIAESARKILVPTFITSGKYEKSDWIAIFDAIGAPGKVSFLPSANGDHGSPALWPGAAGSAEYWKAVDTFLKEIQ